jgi:hypothetical protein
MTVFRDLAQHILDIYENGAKAGATVVYLDIEEHFAEDRLTITLQDNGKGMDVETLQRVTDPWVTSRTTRRVGLGIPFLKQTAEMCGGSFEITSEPGKGTRTHATFQHSHIDRPPLGDLIGTLTCMVVGYPDVDVVYHHQVVTEAGERRAFSLDTREIRAVLGDDIPLSNPEVLTFLRTNLEEGLEDVRGEPVSEA